MKRLRLGILASGRGSNLQAIIDSIDEGKLDAVIQVVISDNRRAQALNRAVARGIPAVCIDPQRFPDKITFEQKVLQELQKRQVELVVLAGFMRLLGPDLISAYPHRIINIHPSLLPAFPGLEAQRQALDYGVKYSGCTVHFVDAGMDTGPIIAQAVVPVKADDTVESLAERILTEEHKLFPQVIQWIAQGRVTVEGRKVVIK